ncbi:MAG: hemolysin [Legionella sp.]|nr:MAG: hemolysin [Legionella sp.]PJD97121.1 MAG: hemolysin [Legionella sp.]
MLKKSKRFLGLFLLGSTLSGCLGNLWTGAKLVYDRHDVYKKLNDYQLIAEVNHALYADKLFKCDRCNLDVALFNGDILIAGHLPSNSLLAELNHRLYAVNGYEHLFVKINQNNQPSNSIQDSWITTKIRSQIFADDSIDPNTFKVVTSDQVVYLMGEVKTPTAEKIIAIARQTSGVVRVVTLWRYLAYESRHNMAR